jgi:hypothetical protein
LTCFFVFVISLADMKVFLTLKSISGNVVSVRDLEFSNEMFSDRACMNNFPCLEYGGILNMRKLAIMTLAVVVCMSGAALAAVDVEMAFAPDTVAPGDEVQMFSSIANMGDAETVAALEISISFMGYEVGPLMGEMPLAAGEELSQEFAFIAPPLPMSGTMEITISATADGVTNTSTATLNIVVEEGVTSFDGLDSLGDDLISKMSGTALPDDSATFGGLKAMFR